jgi:hypothetical protein
MLTCHDKFIRNALEQKHLCQQCCNYMQLIPKKKAQSAMGVRFTCIRPSTSEDSTPNMTAGQSTTIAATPSPCIFSSDDSYDSDVHTCSGYNTSSEENKSLSMLLSPPRKSVRESPMRRRIVRARNNHHRRSGRVRRVPEVFSQSPLRKSRTAASNSAVPLSFTGTELTEKAVLESELHAAQDTIRKLNLSLTKCRTQLSRSVSYKDIGDVSRNPERSVRLLVQALQKNNIPAADIVEAVLKVMTRSKKFKNEMTAQIIASHEEYIELASYFETKMYKQVKYKFRPWLCLQELDLNASVSFRAYDAIRMIEFAEEENKKYRRGIFYSRHKLTKLCRLLESFGKDLLPFTLTANSVKFDIPTAVQFLLEKHGLWGHVLADQHVLLAATVDGGDLAWNVTQVSAGIKMIDSRAINPVSGTLLFGNTGHDKIQSRFHCYPLHVIIAKDNKELYQTHLSNFFRDVNAVEQAYPNGLSVAQGADMCSLHKTLGVGGGMKVKKYACYCCSIHRDDLCKPQDPPCEDCIRLGSSEACYHTTMSDESLMERLREEREETVRAWPHLQRLPFNARSRIRVGNHGMNAVLDPKQDSLHIEFEPRSRMERVNQRHLFESEIRLRGIARPEEHSTTELRLMLYEALLVENSFVLLDCVLKAKNLDEAMIRLEQALPCLLHLQNRTAEAIIEHLLRRAFLLREGDAAATQQLISSVETFINNEIFGSAGCSSLWSLPLNADGTLGKIKFANWRARRVIDEIEQITSPCFPNDEWSLEKMKWDNVIESYRQTMKVFILYLISFLLMYCICLLLGFFFLFRVSKREMTSLIRTSMIFRMLQIRFFVVGSI